VHVGPNNQDINMYFWKVEKEVFVALDDRNSLFKKPDQ
jgi:hypothetical protein